MTIKIPVPSLSPTPGAQGRIRVAFSAPVSDYDLVSGSVRAPFPAPPGGQALGSLVVPCAFDGAGVDPSGQAAFFLPPGPGATVPAGPYVAVLEIV